MQKLCANSRRGHDNIVFVEVSRQGGVVGLDVQLEVALQTIMSEETYDTHGVCKKETGTRGVIGTARFTSTARVDVWVVAP